MIQQTLSLSALMLLTSRGDHLTCRANAYQQYITGSRICHLRLSAQKENNVDRNYSQKLRQYVNNVVENRHLLCKSVLIKNATNNRCTSNMYQAGNCGCHRHTGKYIIAGKTPDAVVQSQSSKNTDAQHRVDRRKAQKSGQVQEPEGTVKPQPQCYQKRDIYRQNIVDHQIHGNDSPMLDTNALEPLLQTRFFCYPEEHSF